MRKCNCSGLCGPQSDGVSRREFVALVGAGAAGAVLGGAAGAQEPSFQMPADALAAWKRDLAKPAPPRRYRSDRHTDARMHLGGIGTGNVEIGADGRLTTWQLFNTLRDGDVPLCFAIRAGGAARLLQTTGGPDVPRVTAIEMTGEYPVAVLKFEDETLPVRVELEAFSPFAPLDTRMSSIPAALFLFKLHNPTSAAQTVSLAAFMQNPVGYDAAGTIEGNRHPQFGGNYNRVDVRGKATALKMLARQRAPHDLDQPVRIYTNLDLGALNAPFDDRPRGMEMMPIDRLPARASDLPPDTLVWFEDAGAETTAATLNAARAAAEAGATVAFAGASMPLLASCALVSGGKPLDGAAVRPDIVFDDFEGDYRKWTVTGDAFGMRPAAGTLQNQQPVTGYIGHGLVNSYGGDDRKTGTMTSEPFTISRGFIRFLVGGGGHPDTQIRLIVDGQVARAAAGRFEEKLLPVVWDVRDLIGRTAMIRIVDEATGGWGHINVDDVVLTDLPGGADALKALGGMLPATFSGVEPVPTDDPVARVALKGLALLPGARRGRLRNGLEVVARPMGDGSVCIVLGAILQPDEAAMVNPRQRAYPLLGELAGVAYDPPEGMLSTAPGAGDLAIVALGGKSTVLEAFDDWRDAWQVFAAKGAFDSPEHPEGRRRPSPPGRTVNGAIASTVEVPAGQTVEVPFALVWRYPNKYNAGGAPMGTWYSTVWPSIEAVIDEVARDFSSLHARTQRFRKTFYDSTLPWWMLDRIASQAATIRHIGVVFRIANRDVYGWEGSNGCCQPTCTHVWGYEQSLARLFPDLEREMRRIDFMHQQRPDGGIDNRTDTPSPPHPTGEHPFADGHASCVLKAWREALNQTDDAWMRGYWPHVRRAVGYLMARDAAKNGGVPCGVLQDDQWNTYDEALHGVTTFIGTYYLAALRAGEEWAKRVGDVVAAMRFHDVFERGSSRLVELCWNGEYFQQHLAGYEKMPGEVGPGCMADQMLGQWWAHQLGLGYLMPEDKVRSALRAVYAHNWKSDLTGWCHAPRAFAGAGDKGLIAVTWPRGGRPPSVLNYSNEVWTGMEYQVAAHLIYEGMVTEGLSIVKGVSERYDGAPRPPIPRNPWNELECGGHYARAMSSWSVLLAASGFEYDGLRSALRFTPRITPGAFKAFFCGPEGWGTVKRTRRGRTQRSEIRVVEGRLAVRTLRLDGAGVARASVGGAAVPSAVRAVDGGVEVALETPVMLKAGDALVVTLA